MPPTTTATLAILLTALLTLGADAATNEPQTTRTLVTSGSKRTPVMLARANQKHYQLQVALANNKVGGSAELQAIAQATKASCAINGSYLAAYPGESGQPYGTIIIAGRVTHIGDSGDRLDITSDGRIHLTADRAIVEITTTQAGKTARWTANNINHRPTKNHTAATIYTRDYGPRLNYPAPITATIRNNRIQSLTRNHDATIPSDGFLVTLQGKATANANKLTVGTTLSYQVLDQASGQAIRSHYSLPGGPIILHNGLPTPASKEEERQTRGISALPRTRSVVGSNQSGEIILAVFPSATLLEAANAMRSLGAENAINLDGGGSSGLLCGKTILQKPAREIANALILKERP